MIDTRESWHLEKKVPVTIIVALMIQSATIIWWAAGMEGRTRGLEMRLAAMENVQVKAGEQQGAIMVQLATMTERLTAQTEALRRIETALEKKVDRK